MKENNFLKLEGLQNLLLGFVLSEREDKIMSYSIRLDSELQII